jgi:hypothetical protein
VRLNDVITTYDERAARAIAINVELRNITRSMFRELQTMFIVQSTQTRGFHINCWRAGQYEVGEERSVNPSTLQECRRTWDGWDRNSAFASCCRLSDNLCE